MINKNNANKASLYLDVDGVILGKLCPDSSEIIVAAGATSFLKVCSKYFNCYWLSTHCKDGDISSLIKVLRPYGDKELIEIASKITPVKWNTMKTEAIDLDSDFFWIEDQPLACEIAELEKHNASENLVFVDTRQDPDALVYLTKIIIRCFESLNTRG